MGVKEYNYDVFNFLSPTPGGGAAVRAHVKFEGQITRQGVGIFGI